MLFKRLKEEGHKNKKETVSPNKEPTEKSPENEIPLPVSGSDSIPLDVDDITKKYFVEVNKNNPQVSEANSELLNSIDLNDILSDNKTNKDNQVDKKLSTAHENKPTKNTSEGRQEKPATSSQHPAQSSAKKDNKKLPDNLSDIFDIEEETVKTNVFDIASTLPEVSCQEILDEIEEVIGLITSLRDGSQ